MNSQLTMSANNPKHQSRFAVLAVYVVLVAVMMFLASQVSFIAAETMQQPGPASFFDAQVNILEDGIEHVSRFCFKSCTFIR